MVKTQRGDTVFDNVCTKCNQLVANCLMCVTAQNCLACDASSGMQTFFEQPTPNQNDINTKETVQYDVCMKDFCFNCRRPDPNDPDANPDTLKPFEYNEDTSMCQVKGCQICSRTSTTSANLCTQCAPGTVLRQVKIDTNGCAVWETYDTSTSLCEYDDTKSDFFVLYFGLQETLTAGELFKHECVQVKTAGTDLSVCTIPEDDPDDPYYYSTDYCKAKRLIYEGCQVDDGTGTMTQYTYTDDNGNIATLDTKVACIAAGNTWNDSNYDLNYYLKPFIYSIKLEDSEITEIKDANGLLPSTAFLFMRQALKKIYSMTDLPDAEDYKQITATIYMFKGTDHFFFTCTQYNKDLNTNYLGTGTDDAITNFCQIDDLHPTYPQHDNVKIVIKPLDCSGDQFDSLSSSEQTVANGECRVNVDSEKPQIQVLDSISYFNVTNSLEIIDIEFRGDQALVETDLLASLYPSAGLAYNLIPTKKCAVTEPDDIGYHEELSLTELDTSDATKMQATDMMYECIDAGFMDFNPPPKADISCTFFQADLDAAVQSLPSRCKGELNTLNYNEFFQLDSQDITGGVFTERRHVLINLYAFDGTRTLRQDATKLTLTRVDISHLIKDYEALIYAENNNFHIGQDAVTDPTAQLGTNGNIISLHGEDRGLDIKIDDTKITQSRFCKGMLVYYSRKSQYSYQPFQILNQVYFDASAQVAEAYQGRTQEEVTKQIVIYNSHFENLNYGIVTGAVSYTNSDQNILTDNTVQSFQAIQHQFKGRGMVMNIQGFPGVIEVRLSKFLKNMISIAYLYPNQEGLEKNFSLFQQKDEDSGSYIKLRECQSYSNRFVYALTDVGQNTKQDVELMTNLERLSPISIAYNEKKIIFEENEFEDNIGLIGGAINIESPNMRNVTAQSYLTDEQMAMTEDEELRPYTFIHNNKFNRNMAYLSGGSISIRNTRMGDDENRMKDLCGIVRISTNEFDSNMGATSSTTGGAVSIACDSMKHQVWQTFSNVPYGYFDKTVILDYIAKEDLTAQPTNLKVPDKEATCTGTATQPLVTPYCNVSFAKAATQTAADCAAGCDYSAQQINYEPWDCENDTCIYPQQTFTIMRQTTQIDNNEFKHNLAGQAGTAIYIRQPSFILINLNEFKYNGPVYSFAVQAALAPYYKYVTNGTRHSMFHYYNDPTLENYVDADGNIVEIVQVTNELQFFESQTDPFLASKKLFLPMVQGAIHIEQCVSPCKLQGKEEMDQFNCLKICNERNHKVEITENDFEKNEAGFALFEEQKLPRASEIMINGGSKSNFIYLNKFTSGASTGGSQHRIQVQNYAPSLSDYMRDGYFNSESAPMIHVYVPKFYDYMSTNISIRDPENEANTTLQENTFSDISLSQAAVKTQLFKGGLVTLFSDSANARLNLIKNKFSEIYILGQEAALIAVLGCSMTARSSNEFNNIGKLNLNGRYRGPNSEPLLDQLITTQAQFDRSDYGIFYMSNAGITFSQYRSSRDASGGATSAENFYFQPLEQDIRENTFKGVFCVRSCIYHVQQYADRITALPLLLAPSKNTYDYIFGFEGAISGTKVQANKGSSDSSVSTPFSASTTETSTIDELGYVLQFHSDEIYSNTMSGVHLVQANKGEVVVAYNRVNMIRSFGSSTTSLMDIRYAGQYICKDCNIKSDTTDPNNAYCTSFDESLSKFEATIGRPVTDYISQSGLDRFNTTVTMEQGAISLFQTSTENRALMIKTDQITLGTNYLMDYKSIDQQRVPLLVKDMFISLDIGVDGTATDNKSLNPNSGSIIAGSTIRDRTTIGITVLKSKFSHLDIFESNFQFNGANTILGTSNLPINTMLIQQSQVNIIDTTFEGNQATYGGAIYVSRQSKLFINTTPKTKHPTIFKNNIAGQSGGCLFAGHSSIGIKNTIFQNNQSRMGSVFYLQDLREDSISDAQFMEKDDGLESLNNQPLQSIKYLNKMRMEVEDSKFINNNATETTIILTLADLYLTKCDFEDNTSKTGTHGIQLQTSRLKADQVSIDYTPEKRQELDSILDVTSGFFNIENVSKLILKNKSTISNTLGQEATIAKLQTNSEMYWEDTIVKNQYASRQTQMIQATHGKRVTILNSEFSHNRISVINDVGTPLVINNTKFHNVTTNTNDSNIIKVVESEAELNSVEVTESVVKGRRLQDQAQLVQYDKKVKGQWMWCKSCTRVHVRDSTFKDLTARQGGAFAFELSKDIFIENCLFETNVAREGGGVWIQLSHANLQNNKFILNRAEAPTKIEASGAAIFFDCQGAKTESECKCSLEGNVFDGNKANSKGGAIMWTNRNISEPITSRPNVFTDTNMANYGNKIGSLPSFLSLQDPSELNPCEKDQLDCPIEVYSKAEFDQQWEIISRQREPEMTFEAIQPLVDIIKPRDNELAIEKEEDEILRDIEDIDLEPDELTAKPKTLYAEAAPGFITQKQEELNRLEEEAEKAYQERIENHIPAKEYAQHGRDLQLDESTLSLQTALDDTRILMGSYFKAISGSTFKLKITTFDDEGIVYSDDQITTCTFTMYYQTGKDRTGKGLGRVEGEYALAKNGVFAYDTMKVFAEPGSIVALRLQVENWSKYSYGKQPPYVKQPLHMVIYVMPCNYGEQKNQKELICERCQVGTFNLQVEQPDSKCLLCPRSALCFGGNQLAPQNGSQRLHEYSDIFFPCMNKKACLGEKYSEPTGKCAEGYQGFMCAQCQTTLFDEFGTAVKLPHWQRPLEFRCFPCKSNPMGNLFISLVKFVLVYIVIIKLSKAYRDRIFDGQVSETLQNRLAVVKLFLVFNQMLFILSRAYNMYESKSVENLQWFFAMHQYVFNIFEGLFFDECLFHNTDKTTLFYWKLAIVDFLPLILLFLNWLYFWLVNNKCRSDAQYREYRRAKEDKKIEIDVEISKQIRSKLKVVMTFWALILYPFLTEVILSSMFCFNSATTKPDPDFPDPKKFTVEEVYRLKVVPDIICYEWNHLIMMIFFGLIPMGFYLIYIPFSTANKMYRDEQRLTLDLKQVPNLHQLRAVTQNLRLSYEGVLALGYVSHYQDKVVKVEPEYTVVEELQKAKKKGGADSDTDNKKEWEIQEEADADSIKIGKCGYCMVRTQQFFRKNLSPLVLLLGFPREFVREEELIQRDGDVELYQIKDKVRQVSSFYYYDFLIYLQFVGILVIMLESVIVLQTYFLLLISIQCIELVKVIAFKPYKVEKEHLKLQVVTILFFTALIIVQMRFFNEYNENIGLTAQNYMSGKTVDELSLQNKQSMDDQKTIAEEIIDAGGEDPASHIWLKKLSSVQIAYLNSYRQKPSEWTEVHGWSFFVLLVGVLIGIEIWFFYLFYIEIVLDSVRARATDSFFFKLFTCKRMQGEKLKTFMEQYFNEDEIKEIEGDQNLQNEREQTENDDQNDDSEDDDNDENLRDNSLLQKQFDEENFDQSIETQRHGEHNDTLMHQVQPGRNTIVEQQEEKNRMKKEAQKEKLLKQGAKKPEIKHKGIPLADLLLEGQVQESNSTQRDESLNITISNKNARIRPSEDDSSESNTERESSSMGTSINTQQRPTSSLGTQPVATGDDGEDSEYKESSSEPSNNLTKIQEEKEAYRSSQDSSYGQESMPEMTEESKSQFTNPPYQLSNPKTSNSPAKTRPQIKPEESESSYQVSEQESEQRQVSRPSRVKSAFELTSTQQQDNSDSYQTSQLQRPTTGGVKRVDAFNMKPRPSQEHTKQSKTSRANQFGRSRQVDSYKSSTLTVSDLVKNEKGKKAGTTRMSYFGDVPSSTQERQITGEQRESISPTRQTNLMQNKLQEAKRGKYGNSSGSGFDHSPRLPKTNSQKRSVTIVSQSLDASLQAPALSKVQKNKLFEEQKQEPESSEGTLQTKTIRESESDGSESEQGQPGRERMAVPNMYTDDNTEQDITGQEDQSALTITDNVVQRGGIQPSDSVSSYEDTHNK